MAVNHPRETDRCPDCGKPPVKWCKCIDNARWCENGHMWWWLGEQLRRDNAHHYRIMQAAGRGYFGIYTELHDENVHLRNVVDALVDLHNANKTLVRWRTDTTIGQDAIKAKKDALVGIPAEFQVRLQDEGMDGPIGESVPCNYCHQPVHHEPGCPAGTEKGV